MGSPSAASLCAPWVSVRLFLSIMYICATRYSSSDSGSGMRYSLINIAALENIWRTAINHHSISVQLPGAYGVVVGLNIRTALRLFIFYTESIRHVSQQGVADMSRRPQPKPVIVDSDDDLPPPPAHLDHVDADDGADSPPPPPPASARPARYGDHDDEVRPRL